MWPDKSDSDSNETHADLDGGPAGRIDEAFELLADAERRYALYYLHSMDDDVASFAELADYVVARDADSVTDLEDGDGTLERLHGNHLPKLEEAGVVEYDARSGDVRYHSSPLLERGLALALRWDDD